MVSLISDRFLGEKFAKEVLSKKYEKTRNLFTYVLIADTIGCNLNCWFCYAWKLLNLRDAKSCTPHSLPAKKLAQQFACKIRITSELSCVKASVSEKFPVGYRSEEEVRKYRDGILKHLDQELPFSRIRISGGEPIFSSSDVFQTDDASEDLISQTIQYWIEFFEELDDAVGQIKQGPWINIAPFDSDWQDLEYPVWLTEAKDRIMVRFDTNGIVFGKERFAKLFYSELFKLFDEDKLNHIHVQIDYSFKGATAKEYMWSQKRGLPTTPENNDREVDLERHPQVRGLKNIFINVNEFAGKDARFKDCVSVTIEKGIDHDPKSKLWLHYPDSLNWQELAEKLGIEFSDVVNHFDLNFGWRLNAKIHRYTKRGAMIELGNGSETVDVASASIRELREFRRQNLKREGFMTLVYPVADKVELFDPKSKPQKEVPIPSSDRNFWIITGSEENLRIAVAHGLWGVRKAHEGLWERLKKGDVLFFYCTRPVSGIVGYGKVIDTHVDTRPFWPNESLEKESKYSLRIKFKQTHVVQDWSMDRTVLSGAPVGFRHGLNYVEPHKKQLLLRRMGIRAIA